MFRSAAGAALAGLTALLVGPAGAWIPVALAGTATPTVTVRSVGAADLGGPAPGAPVVTGIAGQRSGYDVLRADGTVTAYGAPGHGSATDLPTGVFASGITADPATGGYWVVASNGQVFAFDAPWFGQALNPSGGWGQFPAATAIAATPTGSGYYVLRADGSIAGFGAPLHGSLAGRLPYGATAPVTATGLAVDPLTGGYWETTSVGGVYAFDAPWLGSPAGPGHPYHGVPVTGVAATPGGGYEVLRADGSVDGFGVTPAPAGPLAPGATAAGIEVDAGTGGYRIGIDVASVGGYLNPLRGLTSLVPQEIDQGVDYCGSGPVYALGDGVVVNTVSSGWPGGAFLSYRLTDGPAAGRLVYAAENLTPAVSVGQQVTPASVLGILHDSGTCLETGWASSSSRDASAARGEYTGANSTAYGLSFSAALQALGAPPGLVQDAGPPGPLPAGWPQLGSYRDGAAGVALAGAPTGPPVGAVANWLAAAAREVLGAPWNSASVERYAAAVQQGAITPGGLVASLQQSVQARRYRVSYVYRTVLGRDPSAAELAAGVSRLAGVGIRQLAAELAGSREFGARAGGGTSGRISAEYEVFLGRAPDPAGLAGWDRVAARVPASQLALAIEDSTEGLGRLVAAGYARVLHRPVDPAGLAGDRRALSHGLPLAVLDQRLLTSAEFFVAAQR